MRGPNALPYTYQLVTIAEAVHHLGEPLSSDHSSWERVKNWFWATSYGGYFTGMTGRRIKGAVDHLCNVVTSNINSIPDDLNCEVGVLDVFRYQATRTKAYVLMMTTLIADEEKRVRVQQYLGEIGVGAVHVLLPGVSAMLPGNRVVTTPSELQWIRDGLNDSRVPENDSRFECYRIPVMAVEAYRENDIKEFLALRAVFAWEFEKEAIKPFGLIPMD